MACVSRSSVLSIRRDATLGIFDRAAYDSSKPAASLSTLVNARRDPSIRRLASISFAKARTFDAATYSGVPFSGIVQHKTVCSRLLRSIRTADRNRLDVFGDGRWRFEPGSQFYGRLSESIPLRERVARSDGSATELPGSHHPQYVNRQPDRRATFSLRRIPTGVVEL